MNLTAIRGLEEVVRRHFGESLVVARVIGPGAGLVVDIGSGAGFPGVPIAVSWPERKVVLVESIGKKVVFLKELARLVRNLEVHDGRLQDANVSAEWATVRGLAIAGIAEEIRSRAKRVAAVVRAQEASAVASRLALESVQLARVPWDERTVVVSGWMSST
jgi:16S rRNA (guanine527-N7)-methyltransferase